MKKLYTFSLLQVLKFNFARLLITVVQKQHILGYKVHRRDMEIRFLLITHYQD